MQEEQGVRRPTVLGREPRLTFKSHPSYSEIIASPSIIRFRESQLELLTLFGNGLTYREIGETLHVPSQTVKNRLISMRERLGAETSFQALDYALRTEQIKPEQVTGGFSWDAYSALTAEERKIVSLMSDPSHSADGNKKLAFEVGKSETNLKNYITSILAKLKLRKSIQIRLYGRYLPDGIR